MVQIRVYKTNSRGVAEPLQEHALKGSKSETCIN